MIQKHSRKSDLLGRVGGEEFSLFLPNTEQRGASHVAEEIRLAIERAQPEVASQKIHVTASIGIALHQRHGASFAEIQKQADQAMYEAKKQGRNCVRSLSEWISV